MTTPAVSPRPALPVVDRSHLDSAVELVREVCRIPSVLGDEGPLAAFLTGVMSDAGFEGAELQPVLPDRPNAVGEISFGPGRRVVLTGHMDATSTATGSWI
jgi:acetylornithine deacetylase/succinyl-diaminopimelate desuccinylase-like protein